MKVYEVNGKKYVLIDLHHHKVEDGIEYNFWVNKKGFAFGVGEISVSPMSSAGGGGGFASFQEFLDGKHNDFVLNNFGKQTLDAARRNCEMRLQEINAKKSS
jgi:hypothetical protein